MPTDKRYTKEELRFIAKEDTSNGRWATLLLDTMERLEKAEAELTAKRERSTELEAALRELLGAPRIWDHGHFDFTMQHGRGCETCIAQNEARDKARRVLIGSTAPEKEQSNG
jgi:hypothetical protein